MKSYMDVPVWWTILPIAEWVYFSSPLGGSKVLSYCKVSNLSSSKVGYTSQRNDVSEKGKLFLLRERDSMNAGISDASNLKAC